MKRIGVFFLLLLIVLKLHIPAIWCFSGRMLYMLSNYHYAKISEPGFHFENFGSNWVLCRNEYWSKELREFSSDPKNFLEKRGELISFDHRRRAVYLCHIDGRKMVVKTDHIEGVSQPFYDRLARCSRSVLEWNSAFLFEAKKIAAQKNIALFMQDAHFFLAVEYIEGEDAFIFGEKQSNENVKQKLISLSLLVKQMQKEGIMHGDLHPKNIRFDLNGKAHLIDLEKTFVLPSHSLLFASCWEREWNKLFTTDGEITWRAENMHFLLDQASPIF